MTATNRGCSWCPAPATARVSNGFWACPAHAEQWTHLYQAVYRSARALEEATAAVHAGRADDAARVAAYEDALRNIAAASVIARRTPYRLDALQTMLADVEHHLASLIVLGYVPANTGRPITTSRPLDPRDPRAELG